ncbi:MAG: ABC transporter permease [Chloroflexota bacterium]|nr:MAG: ABC transporter permease [Chloroflexota bacterium]
MTRYLIQRVLWIIPVLFFVSLITFTIMHQTPGGPFDQERKIPESVRTNIERKYGLDKPFWQQYADYMSGVVRGDLGPSFRDPTKSVTDIILTGLPVTAHLAAMALVLGIVIGISLGTLAALRRNTWADFGATSFSIIGYSIPNFVLAIVLIMVFTVWLKWLPSGNWGTPDRWIMPTIALSFAPAALIARYTRSSLLEVIRQDYVRTARTKGLTERVVVVRHMLRNALLPVATILGPLAASLVTGSFVVETMFYIPGIGRLFVMGVAERDYSMIMGTTLLYAGVVVVMNLVVDMGYIFLDPRIRLS